MKFRQAGVRVLVAVLALGGAALLPATATAATIDPSVLGTSADTAAGSCWEIKQRNASAASGTYYLLTPAMTAPQQFYCDQTTDGGGWVLVGKGRDGWVTNYDGKGAQADLQTADLTPMSSATTQLPSDLVDGLLNKQPVSSLTDGVRLRRAANTTGTSWQEVRMKYSSRNRWVWTLGAQHPLTSYSFAGVSTTGGVSSAFGTSGTTYVNNVAQQANTYHLGFAYGSSVTGTSDSATYLWSATTGGGSAIPFTQVYLRPQITSSDSGFVTIPDTGSSAATRTAVASSYADDLPWHVSGIAGSVVDEGDVEVQAFTQSGSTMYVGGNFKYVQQDAAGTGQVQQSFLAAFDVNTGTWISTFRPVLNEQVRSLATLPNGSVVAGGDFSQANGVAATSIVALNPVTGATDSTWKLKIENRITGGTLRVNALKVAGNYVYIGGAVTHFTGGTSTTTRYMRSLAMVSAVNGTPIANWNPNFNGTVTALDPSDDGTRVYATGYFTTENGAAANHAAAVSTATGAPLVTPAWTPTWSNSNSYQQAIDQIGSRVYVGGSEHALFSFSTSDFSRQSGHIFYPKGDVQAITDSKGVLYASCHCYDYNYTNEFTWPTLTPGWTQADAIDGFGAFNATTSETIPNFTPTMTFRLGQSVWGLTVDTNGRVWAGGDIVTAATRSKAEAWAGGFARFSPADSTAPTAPSNLTPSAATATTVKLTWSASSDDSGTVKYQILRDDRVIATTTNTQITVNKGGNNRFFVRAGDATNVNSGNVSASTPVLNLGDSTGTPPNASFTATSTQNSVAVNGTASTATSGESITGYSWDFGDGTTDSGGQATHAYSVAGSYIITLTVTDSNGLSNTATRTVTATAPPVNSVPSDGYGRAVFTSNPLFYYRLGETTGTAAADSGPNGISGAYTGGYTQGVTGALANSTNTATTFKQASSGGVYDPQAVNNPQTYSQEIWFRTSSTSGGKLIGLGRSATGLSSQYDRHVYMQANGQVVFGVYNGTTTTIVSPLAYNDNKWHYVVATMSPATGMTLYLDGASVGTNPNTTSENYTGYWRIGGDTSWSGASYFDGTLDEAAVYNSVLPAADVAKHYQLGSVAGGNTAPTASFTAAASGLTASLDASASSDTDGTIASYAWNFGDATTGTGKTTTHTYASAGTYTVTLTVTDNLGATGTTTVTGTVSATAQDSIVIANGSSWRYKYDATTTPSAWNTNGFDASGWLTGNAVLGFGSTGLGTNLDTFATTSARPLTAYFSKTFSVTDTSKVTKLVLTSVGDDGVVIYVNGVEAGRANMPTGTITSSTYASAARNTATANASPVVITVPASLLVNGTNTIAAETHLNSRSTKDMSFDLKATLTTLG